MAKTKYGVQVWYNDDWVWVTHAVNESRTSDRVLSTWTNEDDAKDYVLEKLYKFDKTRIIKLDN